MNASIGSILKTTRVNKNLTRPQLAKKVKLSESYLGHLERDFPIRFSPRLEGEFKKLGFKIPHSLVEKHNLKSLKWRKSYDKKVAKRNKK